MQTWKKLRTKFKNKIKKNAYPLSILGGLFLTVIILTYIIANVVWINGEVRGKSMQPNFYNGDRFFAAPNAAIHRGDILVIDPPGSVQDKPFIKRVIGLPGDQITFKNDVTYINGKAINEPYLDPYKARLQPGQLLTPNFSLQTSFGTKKVPANSYFVLGDNRRQSVDSRVFGFVTHDRVIGVVKMRFWPLNRVTFY
ncbi:signal peptidase I [Lactobacillus sp. XV13L]|nr:signal peptidase I [Lactobacillus sp. XV13L]